MGWDSTDNNIQMMVRTNTTTKIDLGRGVPGPTADRTKVYELAMFSPPGLTQSVAYEVTDLGTGAVARALSQQFANGCHATRSTCLH